MEKLIREFLENKTNELSESVSDLSKLNDIELIDLFKSKINSSLNYMFSEGFSEGFEEGYQEGVNSQKNL